MAPQVDPLSENGPQPFEPVVVPNDRNIVPLEIVRENWSHPFSFQGREYQLFKKHQSRDAAWYVRVQVGGRRVKHGTKTNNALAAVQRAKVWLEKVLGEKWEEVEKLKDRQNVLTLADVWPIYAANCGKPERYRKHSLWAFRKVLRMGLGLPDVKLESRYADGTEMRPEDRLPVSKLSSLLVRDFENALVREYQASAELDPDNQRRAEAKALRVAKSCMGSARQLFNQKNEFPRRYREAGFQLPEGALAEFMKCKLHGKDKDEYFAPPQELVEAALNGISDLEKSDPQVFKAFWLAVGVGLRRGEISRARCEQFIEEVQRDGQRVRRYRGNIGKNGKLIDVQVQERAWAALKAHVLDESGKPKVGPVLDPDPSMQFARRIGAWMKQRGWNTDKKLHELRAYIGSLIYLQNPVAAKEFMRHGKLAITEKHYCHYGKVKVPSVL